MSGKRIDRLFKELLRRNLSDALDGKDEVIALLPQPNQVFQIVVAKNFSRRIVQSGVFDDDDFLRVRIIGILRRETENAFGEALYQFLGQRTGGNFFG